ncbi:MAG: aminopeptidase P family N-terminal domain-containing protein, partial [Akkermansia sp.]
FDAALIHRPENMRYLTGYVIKTTPIFPSSPSAGGGNRGD